MFLEETFNGIIQAFWDMPIVVVCTILVMAVAIFYEWRFGEWPYVTQLKLARTKIKGTIEEYDCAPVLVRIAWHDSGTYNIEREELGWPEAGGANGSIRTAHEIFAPPNAGLQKALSKYLSPIKQEFPTVSWADLFQLASATAIEMSGGPIMKDMRYGRVDGNPKEPQKSPFGLPDARPPYGGPPDCAKDPVKHLKWVFGKFGDSLGDRDIVALSGAHTLGRAFSDRSGTVAEGSGPTQGTKYTAKGFTNPKTGCQFLGKSETAGGKSWTRDWRVFNNSYFTHVASKAGAKGDPDLLAFPTDLCLATHPDFKPHFEEFAADEAAFFEAYAASHVKLSELGAKFDPPEGYQLNSRPVPWMLDLG